MSLIFPPVNIQVIIPVTTADSNNFVTLTVTKIAISSATGTVSKNPAPAISVAATGRDANFEPRLNAKCYFQIGEYFRKIHFKKQSFG